ncbi:Lysophospholipase 1 [Xanthoria parietina]
MIPFAHLFGFLALLLPGYASLLVPRELSSHGLQTRALPNAPDGYTPEHLDCPSTRPTVRDGGDLSGSEKQWLNTRLAKTINPIRDLLRRFNIPNFDGPSYITTHENNRSALPNIGIAMSGGGYRAMLNGAGAIAAFDRREDNSTSPGHLGGLLQSATYLGGLSGGGWLVGSLFMNNFTTVSNSLNDPSHTVWQFDQSIFEGPDKGSIQLLDTAGYFKTIEDQVSDKADAGFNRSVTDYWGRALSFQLINATDGGPAYTWSSIALADNFVQGDTPFPVLVADGRAPGDLLISGNTTVFEFNPFEFGTWDPTTFGFVPVEYLGSNFSNGELLPGVQCVRGFDNAGYVMGTSSSLFNQFLLNVDTVGIPKFAASFVTDILAPIGQDNNDIADYSPNPFYGYHNSTNSNAQSSRLTLVDGGEDLQNIPLHPLIQPNRHVDVIFAVDSSADTETVWPNGTALVATYERNLNSTGIGNGTSFPSIPDTNTFVNLGLNSRPTFFGCNSSNTSSITPLIVYIPNAPYVFQSNITTFTFSYNNTARNSMVQNGYEGATMGNGTLDPQWPVCVGCAILSRSLERTKTQVPQACEECFRRYCWDGTTNSTRPNTYEPLFKGQVLVESGATSSRSNGFVTAAVVGLMMLFM